jgi:hypothetical protein
LTLRDEHAYLQQITDNLELICFSFSFIGVLNLIFLTSEFEFCLVLIACYFYHLLILEFGFYM